MRAARQGARISYKGLLTGEEFFAIHACGYGIIQAIDWEILSLEDEQCYLRLLACARNLDG